MPAHQRVRIEARIDEVGQMFKDEELDMEQVGMIFGRITDSPIMSAGMSLFFKRAYLNTSGLSGEEKKLAEQQENRFVWGVLEKSISDSRAEEVIDLIGTKSGESKRQFKESVTDEELRAFVVAMKSAADDAEIPDDVPELNFADELDRIIDETLAEVVE